jgi:pimeloyl-ACP methyl ester carboxylesterase
MKLFILPGNPPARHFYEVWIQELRERHPSLRAEVAHYPLQVETRDSSAYLERLADTVTEQFLAFRRSDGQPTRLVGHSLGGNLALRVLERVPGEVERADLLHPFLRRPLASARAILRIAHELYRRTPSVGDWLVRAQPVLGLLNADALKMTPDEIRVFAQIAFHEHLTIAQDTSPFDIDEALRAKLRIYSNERDVWSPPLLFAKLDVANKPFRGPALHDFIVRRAERDLVGEFLLA